MASECFVKERYTLTDVMYSRLRGIRYVIVVYEFRLQQCTSLLISTNTLRGYASGGCSRE